MTRLHLVAVLCVLGSLSCAAEREQPDAGGLPCDSHADCNADADGGGACGSLRLCVAGFCEVVRDAGSTGSRVVPCD